MEASTYDPLVFGTSPVRRGSLGTVNFTIAPDAFPGIAALFPHGLRAGTAISVRGASGSGVCRLCYELLAWWSLSYGFCVLMDLTAKVCPAAVASTGANLRRLIVVRPSTRRLDKLASSLGALIDGFPFTVVISPPGVAHTSIVRKAQARATARKAVVLFATTGSRKEPRVTPVEVSLECKSWRSHSLGTLLAERHIEANIVEYGASRVVSLLEKAASPRLEVSVSQDSSAFQSLSEQKHYDRRRYLEVAIGGL